MNTPEIENVLRHAPRPNAPAGLKERLIEQAPSGPLGRSEASPGYRRAPRPWLARWWPALGPAAVSLACAVVFTVQQLEIRDLKATLDALPKAGPATEAAPATAPIGPSPAAVSDPAALEQDEITRLKALANTLSAEVSQLEQLRAQNEQLRAQLSAPPAATLTPEETQALEEARQKAMAIQCVNNLKQLGLAVKLWALDNGEMTPPDLLYMTNEMSTPKILVCPADTARKAATNWASFTAANCSYEYLAPGSSSYAEPDRVEWRCPIHGSVGLCDGSVQQRTAKDHPEWLIQRDGKLYFKRQPPPGGNPP